MSVANQNIIRIATRTGWDKNEHNYSPYARIHNNALELAAQNLKGEHIKLWLYLAKNQDGYQLELSPKACASFGISKDVYYAAKKKLVELGYLVPVNDGSNILVFYEMPRTDSENPKNVVQLSENPKVIKQSENPKIVGHQQENPINVGQSQDFQKNVGRLSENPNVVQSSENPTNVGHLSENPKEQIVNENLKQSENPKEKSIKLSENPKAQQDFPQRNTIYTTNNNTILSDVVYPECTLQQATSAENGYKDLGGGLIQFETGKIFHLKTPTANDF